tara:strand:+ start:224 stop:652 length:429 start_codon:yes stop_codon:yes gene_type:complete
MSCNIYCIEDLHNLKYIGSTKNTLKQRLIEHRSGKKKHKYSSGLLDLDNCEIKLIEICPIERRKYVEQYWIDHIDCVNKLNAYTDPKIYHREYQLLNKEKFHLYNKEYSHNRYLYKKSWGGDPKYFNNLLLISPDIFSYNIT